MRPHFIYAVLIAFPLTAGAQTAPLSDGAFSSGLAGIRTEVLTPEGREAGGFQLASARERDILLDLLRDGDPAVRQAAVRALRAYVTQTTRIRDRLLGVFRDSEEAVEVRYEAAKTLAFISRDSRVRSALLEYGRYGKLSRLRGISFKALYGVSADSRVRGRLLDAARYEKDKEARLGAIWALGAASRDNRVRDTLVNIFFYDEKDPDIRVEALKSLYLGMGSSRVRDKVMDLARDGSADTGLRRPAILLLSAVRGSRYEDLLKDLARYEKDPELRQAAIKALNPADVELVEYFHLVRKMENGEVIDPLAKE